MSAAGREAASENSCCFPKSQFAGSAAGPETYDGDIPSHRRMGFPESSCIRSCRFRKSIVDLALASGHQCIAGSGALGGGKWEC